MPTFGVTIPITGIAYVEVEADSEEEALEKAFEGDVTSDHLQEWETHRQIVEGNVFHGHTNEASAEEV